MNENEKHIEQVDAIRWLPVESITPDPNQPRKYFPEAEVEKLAASIDEYGLLQPVIVRKFNGPRFDFMIVLGEMRYRAHLKLGRRLIKAIVKDMTRDEARDLQLVENVLRRDLTDIELAWEFERRVKSGQTHEQIAGIIGKGRSYVTQRLNLLRLSEEDQQRMLRGELNFSQARALISIKNPEKRARISKSIERDTPTRQILSMSKEDMAQPDVTRVTLGSSSRFGEEVNVRKLVVWNTIHDENGDLRESLPRLELIRAYIKDLKMLRGK